MGPNTIHNNNCITIKTIYVHLFAVHLEVNSREMDILFSTYVICFIYLRERLSDMYIIW